MPAGTPVQEHMRGRAAAIVCPVLLAVASSLPAAGAAPHPGRASAPVVVNPAPSAAIHVVVATWSGGGGWGGERGACDVTSMVERRCTLRHQCALATEPTPCPDPPRPLAGLNRVLTVSFRCGVIGREHVAAAVAPDPLLLRCAP